MGLTLDELKESDEILEKEGFRFFISPEVVKITDYYGGILIDYVDKFYSKGIKVILGSAACC
ncbi:MAG TPA: hypothetical protein PL110_16525 [Candidatus Eremiobacteraeota bacterium]|nr:MAG: hypothetical protein BWY64_01423 [bacterium ADurb.Bin363]HPZ09707.1 hypothetical protein [Candidatus Eremiobacteraeota bacterium]